MLAKRRVRRTRRRAERHIAEKFATLGILPGVGAVTGGFLCPVVAMLNTGLTTEEQVDQLLDATNVIVATP